MRTLALMITLLVVTLFSACQGAQSRGQTLALDIRTRLIAAEKLELTTTVRADYGERIYDFTFKYTGNADKGALEITAPEAIAGLKAEVSVSGGTLHYDGAVLDTGALTTDGLSPAEAIPVLLSQWQSGYISGCNYEKIGDTEALAVTTEVSQTVKQRTWFDVKTHLPIKAELSENGKLVIACQFENVIIE